MRHGLVENRSLETRKTIGADDPTPFRGLGRATLDERSGLIHAQGTAARVHDHVAGGEVRIAWVVGHRGTTITEETVTELLGVARGRLRLARAARHDERQDDEIADHRNPFASISNWRCFPSVDHDEQGRGPRARGTCDIGGLAHEERWRRAQPRACGFCPTLASSPA